MMQPCTKIELTYKLNSIIPIFMSALEGEKWNLPSFCLHLTKLTAPTS